jgi:hypothetical protein
MSNNSIPLYKDLLEIVQQLEYSSIKLPDCTIVFEVTTRDALNKINEDFFYKSDIDNKDKTPVYGDKIVVNINGVKFAYVLKE